MKKSMSVIALFAAFLLTVSAHTERVFEAAEGYNAPLFSINDGDSTISLADMKGRYVLLTFWNSTDPASRINVNRYEAIANEAGEHRMTLLAVNLDRNISLFEQIKRVDNLSAGKHLNISRCGNADFPTLYHLENGLNSYLIDPQGKIVAVNPDEALVVETVGTNDALAAAAVASQPTGEI